MSDQEEIQQNMADNLKAVARRANDLEHTALTDFCQKLDTRREEAKSIDTDAEPFPERNEQLAQYLVVANAKIWLAEGIPPEVRDVLDQMAVAAAADQKASAQTPAPTPVN